MRTPENDMREFVIHGGDNAFATRQKQLFEQLSRAEKECNKDHSGSSLNEADVATLRAKPNKARSHHPYAKQIHSEMRQFRGRESIFKRPEGPAPVASRRTVADHHRNPHKWVKYSLDDVQIEDMSDRSNAQAAFSFLRELRARRSKEKTQSRDNDETQMDTEQNEENVASATRRKFTSTIKFRKSIESRRNREGGAIVVEKEERPVFRSSKIVMPEYVVGQKQEKKVKRTKATVTKIDRLKQLKLDHLEEPDE